MTALRIPAATYRLQFHRRFRFEHATALVPYLDALGITDLYASPVFQARRGSSHGYDVTDPTRLNVELGAEENFESLANALRERGMGLLLDIVPNHMAASVENRWWTDVL
ncbi:MAG TPA: alpha-amylase family glycosyl hydrolase, partial [Desulfobacteria bacterium]|nr:alpha-amylase family glycosyl hydrolase [Desulfobacteria bacterium]